MKYSAFIDDIEFKTDAKRFIIAVEKIIRDCVRQMVTNGVNIYNVKMVELKIMDDNDKTAIYYFSIHEKNNKDKRSSIYYDHSYRIQLFKELSIK